MLSKSPLKIVLAGIFQFDIPSVPMTKDNPGQTICTPHGGLQWNPTLGGTPVCGTCHLHTLLAPDDSGEDWPAQQLLGFSLAAFPPSPSLPRAGAGERFSGEQRGKCGYKGTGTLPTLTSDTCGPHQPGLAKLACEPPGAAQVSQESRHIK